MLVLKATSKVRLCLEPVRFDKVLFRPVHKGLKLNDILQGLIDMKYLTLINMSSGYHNLYHNLKLDKKPSYLTTLSCPLWQVSIQSLPIGTASAGDMFPRKKKQITQWHAKCNWYC